MLNIITISNYQLVRPIYKPLIPEFKFENVFIQKYAFCLPIHMDGEKLFYKYESIK